MRKLPRLATLACTLFLGRSLAVEAQSAVLLRDIGQSTSGFGESSGPRQLTPLDDKVVFIAGESDSGGEPWISDGTALGTRMLADVCPGSCGENPALLGVAGHTVFWLGVEEPYGASHLWRSDGTQAGSYRLGDEMTRAGTGNFRNPSAAIGGGALYFVGCTEAQGCEPWRSDGTREGTRLVADIWPGSADGSPGEMTWVAGRIFFVASNSYYTAPSLWASDGTAAGTVSLGKFKSIHHLTAAGNRLFFFGGTGDEQELWTSDGTAAGTRAVSAFHAAQPFASADYFPLPLAVGDHVYFQAMEDRQGIELWRGGASGVTRVSDLVSSSPFPNSGRIEGLLQETAAGRFAFLARKDGSDQRIYLYGGSGSSSVSLMTVCSESCDLFAGQNLGLAKAGSRAVFRAGSYNQGALWSTDGTSSGTVRLTPASLNVATRPVSGGGSLAYFWASVGSSKLGLWSTDGTVAGTKQIAWGVGGLSSSSYGLPDVAAVGSRVFFRSGDTESGDELRVTDGTREGDHLVLDVARNEADSNPQELVALGDRIFFSDCGVWQSAGTPESTQSVVLDNFCAPPGSAQMNTALTPVGNLLFFLRGYPYQALWRSDGTEAGTFPLTTSDVVVSGPVAFQGKLYFVANRSNARPEIWSSDGTVAGTAKAFDMPQPLDIRGSLYSSGSHLYFNVNSQTWWISDGTTAGTRQLSLDPTVYGRLERFVSLGGVTYFQGDGHLVRSDGTPAGTTVVQLSPDGSIFNVQDLTLFHGALYFIAGAGYYQRALFRSDGTTGGTVEIHRFEDPQHSQASHLTVFQDQLFFAADDGEHGFEIWKSDGTSAGTVLLKDVAPGPVGSHPEGFAPAGDRLYFVAGESVHGRELWKTDGTSAGTELAQDLRPLGESSNPGQPVAAGGHLFFSADDGLWGRELWALPLGAAVCQPSDASLCLNGGRFRVEARWQDFSGNYGMGHAVALTPDTGYFWFFDPKNVETILKVLDGQGVNQHYWVFYGGLSNLEYELTVTDTRTGLARRYFNLPGQFASVGDTQGFGPLGAYKSRTVAAASPPPVVSERFDAAAATGVCVPGPDRLCLNDGRFSVQAEWKDFSGHAGAGTAVGLTGDTGYFWFFDSSNVEVVLKVLDGRPVNGKFWVYYGALSNVEYTLTVTDTMTGKVKVYANPPGRFASAGDSSAF